MEPDDIRIKRLAMRSMRRGIKEMDLILSDFSGRHLTTLSAPDLDLYETLLDENDHDLYLWISGQGAAPPALAGLVGLIAAGATGLVRPT